MASVKIRSQSSNSNATLHFESLRNVSPVPMYRQIADEIKRQISARRIKAGALLPTQGVLSGRLRVHAATVRRAYNLLKEDGIALLDQSTGTYVIDHSVNTRVLLKRRVDARQALRTAIHKSRHAVLQDFEILKMLRDELDEHLPHSHVDDRLVRDA